MNSKVLHDVTNIITILDERFNKLYHERLPYDKFSYLIPYFNIISYLI